MELDDVHKAVYSLIKRYVDRQQLVRNAIHDLRPDLLIVVDGNTRLEELVQMTERHSGAPQSGQWGQLQEWSYFIHGRGCRLIHTTTREPIEWDAPDIRRFDRFWFMNYVTWLSSQIAKEEDIVRLTSWLDRSDGKPQDLVFGLVQHLWEIGMLTAYDPLNRNKFTLVSED
jgi:hypothetical protein